MIQIAIVDDERAFLESYTHIVEKLFAKNRIEFVVQLSLIHISEPTRRS